MYGLLFSTAPLAVLLDVCHVACASQTISFLRIYLRDLSPGKAWPIRVGDLNDYDINRIEKTGN